MPLLPAASVPRPAVMPPPPFIISGSGCPTPSREQVPVCPVTTCFPGLQPTTSLPHFLSSACQKDADCSALPPRGRRAHRPPRRPSTVQWPRRGPELACPAPLQRLPAPGLEKTKQNKQKPCCPWLCTRSPDLLPASLKLHHITGWSTETGAPTEFYCFLVQPSLFRALLSNEKQNKAKRNSSKPQILFGFVLGVCVCVYVGVFCFLFF